MRYSELDFVKEASSSTKLDLDPIDVSLPDIGLEPAPASAAREDFELELEPPALPAILDDLARPAAIDGELLDLDGLAPPLALLLLNRRLQAIESGNILRLRCEDSRIADYLGAFSQVTGNLIQADETPGIYTVQRK